MGRRLSDGKSMKVAVPALTVITKGQFYLLDGLLGIATQSMETNAGGAVISFNGNTVPAGIVPAEITLTIEPAEYETSQIDAVDAFLKGDKVYWDVQNKRFTTVASDGVFCAVVTAVKAAGVVWLWFAGRGAPQEVGAAVADLVAGNAQGVQASLGTGVVGNNNAITWTADKVGDEGDEISVEMVDPGQASQALAVAVVDKDIDVSLATDAGTAASGTSGVEGNNNGLTWTAKAVGVGGNDIVVALEDPDGNDQVLAITVNDKAIVARLATGPAGAITTTGVLLKAAIEGNQGANALVSVAHTGASTGAAAVTDQVVELAGGVAPAISSTATLVIAAVNANQAAAALLTASNTGASSGAGIVVAVAETPLAGGVDSEGQQALVKINELLASLRAAGLLAV